MIVKVQLSMPGKDKVLVYNKSKKYLYEGKSTKDIIALLKEASPFKSDGGYKAFFQAELVKDKQHPNGIKFELGEKAKWQDW